MSSSVLPPPRAAGSPRASDLIDSIAAVPIGSIPLPKPGANYTLPGCYGAADALLLARLAQQHGGTLVVVTAQPSDAERLAQEIGFFEPALAPLLMPDWETLPYDTISPHQDLISARLDALQSLSTGKCKVLLVSASTAAYRLAPPSFIASRTFFFNKGQTLDEKALRAQLVLAGYEHVSQVVKPGEYCVRGGLIDLYPMGATLPYRLDLLGDEIESIRTFDPDTQRSVFPVDSIRLLPGREFPTDDAARTAFRGRWRERFEGDPSKTAIYRDLGSGIISAGLEYYLALFFDSVASVFDFVPEQSVLVAHGDLEAALRKFQLETTERHKFLRHDRERPVLDPIEILLPPEEFFVAAKKLGRWSIASTSIADAAASREAANARDAISELAEPLDRPPNDSKPGARTFATRLPAININRRADNPISALESFLAAHPGRVLIIAESPGRRETMHQMFAEHGLDVPLLDDWRGFLAGDLAYALAVAPLSQGFLLSDSKIAVITESELYSADGRRVRHGKRDQQTNVDSLIRDLSELRPGDPVVHAQHGIGRYQGLVPLDLGDGESEFLHLKYAGDTTLYVPVAQLHLIGRYSGANPDTAPLHQLGSGQWEKARQKAAKQARDTAAELLNIYARRAAREGHAFKFHANDYESFAEGFAFEETPDQLAAIHAVTQDMISGKPMDRLVCGDVGFGKTEVALRAAFVAIADGKQVAVLAPTTLLAEQHFQTFSDRFADWPVKLAELSRFRSAKEVSKSIDEINAGQVDIAIGTHKLLSSDLKFKRLGLVIIDEEHRFGVRQKEALKALRAEVDVLTLTATPIPRTLAMSLEGIRDFSVIATAPQRRLAIKTFVRRESDGIIREALLRELKRGGQAYFLHNEVETIENRRQMLERLVPEARIAVAHGQMPERGLEGVMRDFHQQRFNVLLCTTIIETGIDVATANTIVMHRADRFGLAQLHQLRGRVGRSHHQAYAYLMIPDETAITKDATKRLEAIQMMEELGSGFYLAMHDLEIRGAGEVLGDSQSGDIQEIGFSLYADMLNEAVRALKEGREPDLTSPMAATTEINLHVPARLPDDYCGDIHERLTLYKRLASGTDHDQLQAIQEEIVDRFGTTPDPVKALFDTHRLRLDGAALGVIRIDASADAIMIQFGPRPTVTPERIIQFIQSRRDVRIAGQDKLRFTIATTTQKDRFNKIRELLTILATPPKVPNQAAAKAMAKEQSKGWKS